MTKYGTECSNFPVFKTKISLICLVANANNESVLAIIISQNRKLQGMSNVLHSVLLIFYQEEIKL